MSTIVVGFDSSDCGTRALEVAVELAKSLGDELVVVFGYSPPGIWGGEIADHEQAIAELGQKLMVTARERAAQHGIEPEVAMVAKRGTEALLEVAEEREARMIVVGSHGEAPLKGALLGSTPNRLLHVADRPVLVVPASG